MGLKIFALLLLSPLIHANIDVEIVAADNLADSAVKLSGNNVAIISDTERNSFKLSDNLLKNAVNAYFGARPDDAYVRSPTPWGDLYQTYGWQQVTRILTPKSSSIVSLQSQPSVVTTQFFENNSSLTAQFTAKIFQSVANTVTSTWTKDSELTIGQEITYGINFKVFSVGGSTSMSYTSSWGQSVSKSQTVTVGSEAGVTISLEPKQKVIAELFATRGSMRIRVDYEATLSGQTAVNYSKKHQGHHFWGLGINNVMSAGGLPRTMKSTEVINMGYYTDSKVVIRDANTRSILYTIPTKVY